MLVHAELCCTCRDVAMAGAMRSARLLIVSLIPEKCALGVSEAIGKEGYSSCGSGPDALSGNQ